MPFRLPIQPGLTDAATPASANAPPPVSALSPLQYPIFRRVWSANLVSSLGGLIQSVGASWMMISLAQSADMVALVQASVTLPIMLLSLIAGAMADNLDRRKVMLGAQSFMLVASAALSICAWTGVLTPWLLLTFTFLIGCGGAFNQPAWQATVADMVPRAELPGAVALNSMGFNLARSVGPAIGGAIVAAFGAAAAFAVNSLSYVALISVLARWRLPVNPQRMPRESLGNAVTVGIRYMAMSPAIATVLLRSAAFCIGASAVMSLMPLIAKELISGGPLTFGALLGGFGVGAVGGAVVTARLRKMWSTEVIVRSATIGFGIAAAGAALSTHVLLTMAALSLAGASWVLALATFNVAVQMSAPRWVLARALSIYQMSAFGGLAAGSWLWGIVATHAGLRITLLLAAAIILFGALLGRWFRLEQAEALNLDPLRLWREPATAVPVQPTTGPVVVTVEYLIDADDVLAFLGAMAELRRIRRRDGALNWRLLRDLADAQIWIERYETPTWVDYIRLTNRLTQDDALIRESLHSLHRGKEPPRVRRMIERQTSLPVRGADASTELTET